MKICSGSCSVQSEYTLKQHTRVSKSKVDEMQACHMGISFLQHPCTLHKEPISGVQVISVPSLRAAWLLEFRKLNNQGVVYVSILWVSYWHLHITWTPCAYSIFARSVIANACT